VVALGRIAPVEDSSEGLARLATGGDDAAFEALIRRYQRRVHGFAYQHLHDPDEAQDLAQEIFVRLYRALAAAAGAGLPRLPPLRGGVGVGA